MTPRPIRAALLALFCFWLPPVQAQPEDGTDAAIREARARIESSLERLRSSEAEIAEEKTAVLEQLRQLEALVASRRTELERLRSNRDQLDTGELKRTLATESAAYRDALLAVRNLATSVETSTPPESLRRLLPLIDGLRPDATATSIQFLNGLLDELESLGKPMLRPTEAVDPDGVLLSGESLRLGPQALFFRQGSFRGYLFPTDGLWPRLTPAPGVDLPLPTGKAETVSLPIDPTLGAGTTPLPPVWQRLYGHLALGGFWILPILALAALALAVALVKILQLSRIRVPLDPATARGFPAAGVIEAFRGSNPGPEREEALATAVLRAQAPLERFLSILAVTASTAPLLGLLGTVTGIIEAFTVIASSNVADPKALSGGISEALVTTEVGLIVAIPALVVHAFLSRRVQAILQQLDDLASRLLETHGSGGGQ